MPIAVKPPIRPKAAISIFVAVDIFSLGFWLFLFSEISTVSRGFDNFG